MASCPLAVVLIASGCSFGVDGVPGVAADMAEPALDSAQSLDLAQPADLTRPPDLATPFCGEAGLVACYQFEDGAASTVAVDGTANQNNLALTSCNEIPGGHSGGGLSVSAGSLAHRDHNASFDVAQLTIEMWVKPSALPGAGARAGLADEDGQYGLFIYNPGVLTCSVAGSSASSPANTVQPAEWHHVACTYDQQTIRLYFDGAQIASTADTAAIATNQPNGLNIGMNSPSGDNLTGVLDDVRIFSLARPAADICRDAGGNGCSLDAGASGG